MLTDDGYVLDADMVVRPPAGAILDLVPRLPDPEPESFEIDVPLEDDVADPSADLSWQDFVSTLHDGGYADAEVRTVLALVVMSKGRAGELVDLDALAEAAGRKPTTVAPMLGRLVADGWLEAFAELSPKGRPVKRYRTARTIG